MIRWAALSEEEEINVLNVALRLEMIKSGLWKKHVREVSLFRLVAAYSGLVWPLWMQGLNDTRQQQAAA